jgi:membrane protease YdiL (CAAX protease family)
MALTTHSTGSFSSGTSSHSRPWLFFLGTFAWTWTFWWAAAISGMTWAQAPTWILFALGGVGPVLTAAVLVHRGGRAEERDFWWRVIKWRMPRTWWWAIPVVAVLPYLSGRLAHGSDGSWLQSGVLSFLAVGVLAGLVEEPGWRGYAQDSLQRQYHPVTAALLVGTLWALWHLPLFFISGSFQNGLAMWSTQFWLFFASLVAWAFVYAAVYLATGRSILAVAALHALSNAAAETLSADGAELPESVVLAGLALAAAAFLLRTAPSLRDTGPGRAHPRRVRI